MLDLPGHRAAGATAAAAMRLPALCAHGLHLALVPSVGRQPVRSACFLPARPRDVLRAACCLRLCFVLGGACCVTSRLGRRYGRCTCMEQ